MVRGEAKREGCWQVEMMQRMWFGWLVVLFLTITVVGCGKREVYIPPEWASAPPPAQESAPTPSSPLKSSVSPPEGPILEPPPSFKERDLSEEPGKEAQATRKVEPEPPQQLASMHLVDQGKAALAQGKPDAAISFFEKAVQVDVYSGEAFLGLARAWLMKGSRNKAIEFVRKAEILFQDNNAKLKEVYLFQADIYNQLHDDKKVEFYRDKASRL